MFLTPGIPFSLFPTQGVTVDLPEQTLGVTSSPKHFLWHLYLFLLAEQIVFPLAYFTDWYDFIVCGHGRGGHRKYTNE